MSRRLGGFGLGLLIAGALLVGTGVAVSAQPSSKAATAGALKKKPTTTTTSTTVATTVPASTTTQPCTPTPTTATGVNTTVTPNTTATLTANPGTCIVSGTVVSLSGTGYQFPAPGTFLECNSDPTQPTVLLFGSQIPVSCTNPLAKNQGPGVISLTSSTMGPYNYTVLEATQGVGPPCGTSCTGAAATDSSGGSTVADAAKYPCPPTAAQIAAQVTCGITFGDSSGDGVTVPLTFNTAVATPSTIPPTVSSTGSSTVPPAASPGSATPATTKTTPGALAFTGAGPGLWWLALVGLILIVLGVMVLSLIEEPRRLVRLAADRVRRKGPDSP